jgi:glycosyltransferase involved in cell wall biosynthesis
VHVAFLLADLQLSGGVGAVLTHGQNLSRNHGIETSFIVLNAERQWSHYEQLADISIVSIDDVRDRHFDIAIATWWETVYALSRVNARRYAYFVQSLEDRFYLPEYNLQRLSAALTHDLPLFHITEALWVADILDALHGDVHTLYVRNGVDKETFQLLPKVEPRIGGPLRITIEGRPSVWFKAIGDAIEAASHMSEDRHVTLVAGEDLRGTPLPGVQRAIGAVDASTVARVYAETDVMLKLSRVEGMAGPPLEAFHLGATAVMTPVTGYDEYAVHGWNSLVVDFDDLRGTGRQLDLLARDRRYLHYLKTNALATARTWPSWEQSSQIFALALRRIASSEVRPVSAGTQQLLRDLGAWWFDSGTTTLAESDPVLRLAQRLRSVYRHPFLKPLRPVSQRLARRLTR